MAKSPAKRFSSRPAILPTTKDRVTDSILDGLDKIRDALDAYEVVVNQGFPFKRLLGRVQLKVEKGRPNTIWVAYARFKGAWGYKDINRATKAMAPCLPKETLVFLSLKYAVVDDDGEVVDEIWTAIGTLQVWASAIKQLASLTTPNGKDSLARRYKSSLVTEISINLSSKAMAQ